MTRNDLVLAVLSTASGEAWAPVQVQKIFFLIDQKIPDQIGGKKWNFAPYDYGPFDPAVYRTLEALGGQGLLSVSGSSFGTNRTYRLTIPGQNEGERQLAALSPPARSYVERLSAWLRPLSFQQLVSAVYRDFPEMKEKSIFKD